MKKDSTPFIIAFIVLGAIILCGGYYLFTTSKPKPQTTAVKQMPPYQEGQDSSSSDQTGSTSLGSIPDVPIFEWKMYNDDARGYGFSYPNTWRLTEKSNGLTLDNPKEKNVFTLEVTPGTYDEVKAKVGSDQVTEEIINALPVVVEQKEDRTSVYTFAASNNTDLVRVTMFGNSTTDEVEYSLLQQVVVTLHKL